MDYYNSKAEAANFAFYNPTPTYKQIDLHGLYVAEAMARVEKHMEDCKRAGIARTRFITGKGNRSKDNIPKIKIAVLNYLKQQGVKIEPGMEEQGSVIAILDENAPEQTDVAIPIPSAAVDIGWKIGELVGWAMKSAVWGVMTYVAPPPEVQNVSARGDREAGKPDPFLQRERSSASVVTWTGNTRRVRTERSPPGVGSTK